MGESSNFNGSKTVPTVEKNVQQKIKDVHIVVFFDGTNNNAVQKAIFYSYKKRKEQKKDVFLSKDVQKQYDEAIKLKDEISELERIILLVENSRYSSYVSRNELSYLKKKLEENKKKISTINLHPLMDTASMDIDNLYGYSNVSILYSLLNRNKKTENAVYYDLYIEGAGATDIVEPSESNVNGLGFGLGETGVTALVSKAINNITEFLQSSKACFTVDTNYHFYVFGFSRGSTCARLFAELTTREKKKKLKREKEFSQRTSYVSHLIDGEGRIPFMEENYFHGMPLINRSNVTVDFLGIYDTVASIGFLKQKDGWTNALSLAYRPFVWNNYHGNFHYMNVRDYGLFSHHNPKVLFTCHICAGDEFRENFALVNLGKVVPTNATEIIIPGCHSDVGGGYVDEIEMDVVLYKFVPRKLEHFLKSNKLLEIMSFPYLKSKERAKMFLHNPFEPQGIKGVLNPDTLAKLGWIGKEWLENNSLSYPEKSYDNEICTKRVADWPNEIKFKRYVMRGYSNISLRMMMASADKHNCKELFNEINGLYEIPKEIKKIGEDMISKVDGYIGKRAWFIPEGDYSGAAYRSLRLNFIHFTSSCELWHFRSPITSSKINGKEKAHKEMKIDGAENTIFELHGANIGNNCNYDNDSNICRIMYFGDEVLKGNHKENVHYMYELGDANTEIVCCNG